MASRTPKIILGSVAAVVLAVLPALLLVKAFLVGYYVIPQNGMYPSLPSGSRLLTIKHPYAAPSEVKRGDIIVFTRDQDSARYNYIWRVVGLPGDTIEAAGVSLAVNGTPVARERLREEQDAVIFRERADETTYEVAISQSPREFPPDASLIVPPDHFFVAETPGKMSTRASACSSSMSKLFRSSSVHADHSSIDVMLPFRRQARVPAKSPPIGREELASKGGVVVEHTPSILRLGFARLFAARKAPFAPG